jgi:hypothetical protein
VSPGGPSAREERVTERSAVHRPILQKRRKRDSRRSAGSICACFLVCNPVLTLAAGTDASARLASLRRESITLERDPSGALIMPEKKTIEKAQRDLQRGKSASTAAGEFVHEEIDHIRRGKHGARSTKQAIAIGLSKARRAGVPLPTPSAGQASESTRRSAQRDSEIGKGTRVPRPSAKRRRASRERLKREPRAAASKQALSRQAKAAAARRRRTKTTSTTNPRSASSTKRARSSTKRTPRTSSTKRTPRTSSTKRTPRRSSATRTSTARRAGSSSSSRRARSSASS